MRILAIITRKRKLVGLWTLLSLLTRKKLKESDKKDKYLDLARVLKKKLEQESDSDTKFNWYSWYNHRRIGTGTGRLGNKMTSGDDQNYSFF